MINFKKQFRTYLNSFKNINLDFLWVLGFDVIKYLLLTLSFFTGGWLLGFFSKKISKLPLDNLASVSQQKAAELASTVQTIWIQILIIIILIAIISFIIFSLFEGLIWTKIFNLIFII